MATYEVTAKNHSGTTNVETVDVDTVEDQGEWVEFRRGHGLVLRLKIANVSRIERKDN